MDVLKRLRRLACRHEYGWSERRGAEVCYNCGQVREATDESLAANPHRQTPPGDTL